MKLHTYGLLNNSYRPPSQVLVLRAYWRQRAEHVQGAAQSIQRMQKVLTEMNLQLANVISDISGVTGQAIIRAILAGERDPHELAKLRDFRIKASPEQIAKSLEGNWRRELLFLLGQHVEMLDAYQRRIAECDRELEAELKNWAARESGQQNPAAETVAGVERKEPESKARGRKNKKKSTANAPRFDLGSELQRINGVDLTKIDGIHVMAAQTVLSEVGYDLSRWKTEAHFVSWLGLCPNNEISGGRVLKRRTRHVVHPLATALRLAAWGLFRSQSYLGAQYRRLRTRLGAPKAITAMAAKLARLIYRMLKFGEEYVDKGMQYYEQKYRAQQIQFVKKKAAQLGLQVVEYKATA